ncbi:MAG TPA: 30S ribosomal protein S16 [Candidatus Paceibacterota bacterium]|jgi:small subunit ribosomal protein S16|nr:30S ribosomal protein S16 [Candidatus Paceibacterota bacterium]
MLKIRLQRTGRKHEPTFRLVVTESQNAAKSGKALEVLGSYDARKTNEIIHTDRVKHWIEKGAKPSDTVHNLLVSKKIIEGRKVNALPKKKPIIDQAKLDAEKAAAEAAEAEKARAEAEAAAAAAAAEAPAPAEAPAEEAAPAEAPAETPSEETPAE